jgi:hypothetical protein
MPKRIIDGEALWTSIKLNTLEPQAYRSEYANLLPLALANGVFEADPDLVWSRVYAFNRPDVTPELAAAILDSFEAAKMLFRWQEQDGKVWGYWIGIDKIGRLPTAARLNKRHERIGPEPPQEKIGQWSTAGTSNALTARCADQKKKRTAEAAPARLVFEGQKLQITVHQDAALATGFPWVDRPAEYAKMDSWLVGNTARHIKKFSQFAHNWFAKIPRPNARPNSASVRHGMRLF